MDAAVEVPNSRSTRLRRPRAKITSVLFMFLPPPGIAISPAGQKNEAGKREPPSSPQLLMAGESATQAGILDDDRLGTVRIGGGRCGGWDRCVGWGCRGGWGRRVRQARSRNSVNYDFHGFFLPPPGIAISPARQKTHQGRDALFPATVDGFVSQPPGIDSWFRQSMNEGGRVLPFPLSFD